MDSQPPVNKSNSEKKDPQQIPEQTSNNPDSIVNLKLEVERIYRDVDKLRKLLQTLVAGLILSIIMALGVSSWFAYRLLLQEQTFQRQLEQNATEQEEMASNLEEIRTQLQSQTQQLQAFKEDIPDDLQNMLLKSQQQIQELSDRLEQQENE